MLRYVFFSCSPGHKNVITNRRISKDLLLLIFWKRRKCSIYSAKTLAEPGVTSPLNVAAGQPSELGNTVGGHAGQEGAVPPGSEELRKCSQSLALLTCTSVIITCVVPLRPCTPRALPWQSRSLWLTLARHEAVTLTHQHVSRGATKPGVYAYV